MEGHNNQCDVCGSGNGRCGKCGGMCGFGRYSLLRWFLGILIITWVFSIGVGFGELKASLKNSYNYGQMRAYPMGGSWSGGDQVYFTETVPSQMMTSGTVQIKKI